MAKKSLIVKSKRDARFSTQKNTRCARCGRSRAVFRRFMLCRICFREMAHRGELPGVRKASW